MLPNPVSTQNQFSKEKCEKQEKYAMYVYLINKRTKQVKTTAGLEIG